MPQAMPEGLYGHSLKAGASISFCLLPSAFLDNWIRFCILSSLRVQQDCLDKAKLALRRNGFPSQRFLPEKVG
uniref:Uncharacterized protein n=1 Tax=Tolypothrix bouteillei VB521301 TaxID=1479485 RepID=A0A0C1RKY1_9CYAN